MADQGTAGARPPRRPHSASAVVAPAVPASGELGLSAADNAPGQSPESHAGDGPPSTGGPRRWGCCGALAAAACSAARACTLAELSGALGDLGTFLPLTLGLVSSVGLDLGTTFLFSGAYNVASGLLFRCPMPVQPMKAIAAVAAAGVGVTLPQVMAAGILVSVATLLLGATRLIDLFNAAVPLCVVRGLQLGVGLKLGASGVKLALTLPAGTGGRRAGASPYTGLGGGLRWRPWGGAQGLALGLVGLAFLVVASVAGPAADPAEPRIEEKAAGRQDPPRRHQAAASEKRN